MSVFPPSSQRYFSTSYLKGFVVGISLTIVLFVALNQITISVNALNGFALKSQNEQVIKDGASGAHNYSQPGLYNGTSEMTDFFKPRRHVTRVAELLDKSQPVTERPPHYESHVKSQISHNTSILEEVRLSRTQCAAKFGKRGYFSESEKRLPPMLYTFPGSGNTWCRLLIEYSTSVYSGAVYNDASLLEALPGEFTCNHLVSVVKVHPHTHSFEELRRGTFNSDNGKCKKGNVGSFKRAILLIRNPFDSIWSEFQRRVTQSHVSGIPRLGFDWHRWQANAAALAHQYHEMWARHHAGIEEHFRAEDVLFIRYEDLKSKVPGVNIATMRRVTDFLHVSASQEKLSCAFILAENRDAHRTVDAKLSMTKEDAYTKELTCRMWALFGHFAAKHNYQPYNNHDCTSPRNTSSANLEASGAYPSIPRVNVGAQGEYDRKWVKPGGKLIDFGGYNKSMYSNPNVTGSRRGVLKPRPGGKQNKRASAEQRHKEKNALGLSPGDVQISTSTDLKSTMGTVGLHQPAWKR